MLPEGGAITGRRRIRWRLPAAGSPAAKWWERPTATPDRPPTGRFLPRTFWRRCITCWESTRTREYPIAGARWCRSSRNRPMLSPKCWPSQHRDSIWTAELLRPLAGDFRRAKELPKRLFVAGDGCARPGQFRVERAAFAEWKDEQ